MTARHPLAGATDAAPKRMLADVLWEAANRHLTFSDGEGEYGTRSEFTCDCISYACGGRFNSQFRGVDRLLVALGLPADADDRYDLFNEVPDEQRQGVRYMWLLLAACVAEDEGITLP